MADTEKQLQQQPPPADGPEDEDSGTQALNYGLGVAIGLPIGVALGLTVFDNVGYGVVVGLVLIPIITILVGRTLRPTDP